MQPAFEKVSIRADESFRCHEYRVKRFASPWHQHPEVELTLIVSSSGLRFVGDQIEPFDAGDLVLVGPSLPHCWLNHEQPPRGGAAAVVVQFGEAFLGSDFLRAPELHAVRRLLRRAARGLCFGARARATVHERMRRLPKLHGSRRLLALLEVLESLASAADARALSSAGFRPLLEPASAARIDRVHRFLLEHLCDEIRLEQVAALAHLSPGAFCRYFKRATGKPLMAAVNEMRVGHACRLLLEESRSVSEICYASGFNNLSHFNRQFRRRVGCAPSDYRRRLVSAAAPRQTPRTGMASRAALKESDE